MKVARLATACLLSIVAASTTFAGDPYDFNYTEQGGQIGDNRTSFFPLTMDEDADPEIASLELVITGLTHATPWDLDIYLLDPFGNSVEVLTDRGDMHPVVNLTMTFSDSGSPLPVDPDTMLAAGPWLPEGGTFLPSLNLPGTDAWVLVINDDAAGNAGSFTSWSLRGTVVPEPVTLSLLAIGGLVTLRRRWA